MSEENQKESTGRSRLSEDAVLFITDKANRPGTVFHWIQSMVAEHGGVAGDSGMAVEDAITHMLDNFQPKKSQNFNRTYCRAYINGGVTEGHLTTERPNAASALVEKEPQAKGGGSSESSGSGLTKAGRQVLDRLFSLIDEDDYRNGADVVTVKGLAESLEKTSGGISRTLNSLQKNGYVTVEEKEIEVPAEGEEESKTAKVKYVYLTEEGWNNAQEE